MEKKSSTTGVGFCGLLTLVFIVLKLVGVISWKWLWVLSPLWIQFGVGMIIVAIIFICAIFKGLKGE